MTTEREWEEGAGGVGPGDTTLQEKGAFSLSCPAALTPLPPPGLTGEGG